MRELKERKIGFAKIDEKAMELKELMIIEKHVEKNVKKNI